VIDTLIAETRAALPTLHRYLRVRARLLGIEAPMQVHDLYPPLIAGHQPYSLARSAELVLAAVQPLGAPYVETLRRGLSEGWMDVYPRPRKRAGGYSNGSAYDVHPYLLLNHTDDPLSLSTLAHEWGHALHSYLANRAQPFASADYAAFTAEIAAILNELLLSDHLRQRAGSDDERLRVLGEELERLRGSFFRQVQLSEFEREVHAAADRGEPFSGEALSALYLSIARRYFGQAEGVMQVDALHGVEWAGIPHFYYGFYVFQYATSIAAAALFADEIVAGSPGARERFLAMLEAGGSDDPYPLVQRAGVDLATPAPYRALVARMNRLLDEVEAIEARRARR
jgi:oligoendopeptidase F